MVPPKPSSSTFTSRLLPHHAAMVSLHCVWTNPKVPVQLPVRGWGGGNGGREGIWSDSSIIPTAGWKPLRRMLRSVWCCISWLFGEKGLGQRGQVWLRLPCSVWMCRCSSVGYRGSPHRLMATLLTRLELGGRKSGFGRRKFSKHSLSTASGQGAGRL